MYTLAIAAIGSLLASCASMQPMRVCVDYGNIHETAQPPAHLEESCHDAHREAWIAGYNAGYAEAIREAIAKQPPAAAPRPPLDGGAPRY